MDTMQDELLIESDNTFFYEVVDEEGIPHKMSLITIFQAGDLMREYVAGICCDEMIFRLEIRMYRENEMKYYIHEIDDNDEFQLVSQRYAELGIESEKQREEELLFSDINEYGEEIEVPFTGTILRIFDVDMGDKTEKYVVVCPHNIMFHKWKEQEENGETSVVIEDILSPKEYEDVLEAFQVYMYQILD